MPESLSLSINISQLPFQSCKRFQAQVTPDNYIDYLLQPAVCRLFFSSSARYAEQWIVRVSDINLTLRIVMFGENYMFSIGYDGVLQCFHQSALVRNPDDCLCIEVHLLPDASLVCQYRVKDFDRLDV